MPMPLAPSTVTCGLLQMLDSLSIHINRAGDQVRWRIRFESANAGARDEPCAALDILRPMRDIDRTLGPLDATPHAGRALCAFTERPMRARCDGIRRGPPVPTKLVVSLGHSAAHRRQRRGRPPVRWRRGVRSGPAAAPAALRRPAASGLPADRRRSSDSSGCTTVPSRRRDSSMPLEDSTRVASRTTDRETLCRASSLVQAQDRVRCQRPFGDGKPQVLDQHGMQVC